MEEPVQSVPRFVLIFCLALAGVSAAAQPLPGTSPDEALAQARKTLLEAGPREALPLYERALASCREVGDPKGETTAMRCIGVCYRRLGDFGKALEQLEAVLSRTRQLGQRRAEAETLNNLGLVYWELGKYDLAIEHLESSIAIAREVGDVRTEGASLNNLSLVYDEQGDYERSLQQYERALELHRQINDLEAESYTLGNIGGVHLLLGRYRQAMDYYRRALVISEKLGSKPSMCMDLANLGRCQLGLGQTEQALATFERALALAREAGLHKEEGDCLKGESAALMGLGRYDEALTHHREALAIYETAGLQRELVESLNEVGTLYVLLGDLSTGERSFQRAVAVAREIGYPLGVTLNLMALGDIEWRRHRFEQAAALYGQALERAQAAGHQAEMAAALIQLALTHRDMGLTAEARDEATKGLEIARSIGARVLEAQAHYALAQVQSARGEMDAALRQYASGAKILGELGDPELAWRLDYGQARALESLGRQEDAVAAYRRAIAVIEGVRSQLREERFRAGYIDDKYQVYVDLVQLLLEMGRIEDAFLFSEKLRARSQLDLLNRGLPPVRSAAQRQEEQELRERVRQLQRAVQDESNRSRPEQRHEALTLFSRELAEAERSYQNMLDDLRSSEPAYAAARSLAAPSAQEVRRLLPAGAALIEYVVTEHAVGIFVLTADALRATTVPVRRPDLRAKVELVRDLVARREGGQWRRPAGSLAAILITPVERAGWLEGVDTLYLVPHGILHYLPFALLPQARGDTQRLLVEDFVLAYLPSAADLVHQRSRSVAEATLLAFAPRVSSLEYAQQEVRTISRFYPRGHLLLEGPRATEASFKAEAGSFTVLHLATHGYFNKLNPLLSGIQLEPGGREDGRLEVHEVLDMRLPADLVTLSACETALGSGYFAEVPPGDDFVGLTRAFLFAGSASVLASLWEVNDRSTPELMEIFYRRLREASKAAALATAQREMLNGGGRYAHPYFWAPFALVGAAR
jgi:CHAT domain-containing protein/Tfp pilus assembly protein PilF